MGKTEDESKDRVILKTICNLEAYDINASGIRFSSGGLWTIIVTRKKCLSVFWRATNIRAYPGCRAEIIEAYINNGQTNNRYTKTIEMAEKAAISSIL